MLIEWIMIFNIHFRLVVSQICWSLRPKLWWVENHSANERETFKSGAYSEHGKTLCDRRIRWRVQFINCRSLWSRSGFLGLRISNEVARRRGRSSCLAELMKPLQSKTRIIKVFSDILLLWSTDLFSFWFVYNASSFTNNVSCFSCKLYNVIFEQK